MVPIRLSNHRRPVPGTFSLPDLHCYYLRPSIRARIPLVHTHREAELGTAQGCAGRRHLQDINLRRMDVCDVDG